MQADAANRASQLQYDATMAGVGETRRQYDQSRADQLPWLQTGQRTLGQLESRLPELTSTFKPGDLTQDPGYQFGLNQGMDAIGAQARALGLSNSGGTMKELVRYGTDYAGTKYQEAWGRDQAEKQGIYNMLAGISGTGQVTGSQLAGQGAQSSSTIANLLQSGDAASANGISGAAGAGANAITSGANAQAAARIAAGNSSAANYANLGNLMMSAGMMYDRYS